MSRRRNGEGSIYPVPGGYRGYVWCIGPDGTRYRKYVKGKTYDEARQAWLKLQDEARRRPVSSNVLKLEEFLAYWLKEIVLPNLAPKTYQTYELFVRLHIIPYLGIRDWISLPSGISGNGSTSSRASASAARKGRTPPGRYPDDAAARSVNAAVKPCPRKAAKTPALLSAPPSPALWKKRSLPATP